MSQRRKRKKAKTYKAFDPFCQDKVRVALYNRPNGPHMGKLIMGKTYLSGLDGKCFSRTGRIKKGYRNVPIDLQREFEIEKRQIQEIRNMIRGPTAKQKKKRAEKKQREKAQRLAMQKQIETENNSDITNTNNKNENTNNNLINNQNANTIETPIQSMNELKRLPNESFNAFVKRVKQTAHYSLNHKRQKKKLKWKQTRLERKLKKIQTNAELRRQKKLDYKQKITEQREYERKWEVKKEYIPFGATNDRPPEDLHALGEKLFKKKSKQGKLNENNVNVGALSFANVIKNRAEQMKKEGVMRNYALLKQKRNQKRKADAKSRSKKSKSGNW